MVWFSDVHVVLVCSLLLLATTEANNRKMRKRLGISNYRLKLLKSSIIDYSTNIVVSDNDMHT